MSDIPYDELREKYRLVFADMCDAREDVDELRAICEKAFGDRDAEWVRNGPREVSFQCSCCGIGPLNDDDTCANPECPRWQFRRWQANQKGR